MKSELYNIISPNGAYQIISQRHKEQFSRYELDMVYRIINEIRYVMDSITYDSSGRFIGSFLSNVSVVKKEESFWVYYKDNFVSFTKYDDDYILIVFGKDNQFNYDNVRYSDKLYDVRFGVMCDDLVGVISFYKEQMAQDGFIQKVMLGEKL